MAIIKKTLFVALATAIISSAGITFSAAPASAKHYGNHHVQKKHGGWKKHHVRKRCHWGWVKWKDHHGYWHRKWKQICK